MKPAKLIKTPKIVDPFLSIYDFGKELLHTGDLDPIYLVLWKANLPRETLLKWLLAYWCYYHAGTASYIAAQKYFWKAMTEAIDKCFPRCPERRHFRGANAKKSIAYLQSQGIAKLFKPLLANSERVNLSSILQHVQTWIGFGPWIAFKVADMLERLDLAKINFGNGDDAAIYTSPTKGAEIMWELVGKPVLATEETKVTWAVKCLLKRLGHHLAPPRFERSINIQECETILCKYHSYSYGRYKIQEDIIHLRQALLQFNEIELAEQLIHAGEGDLW